MKILKTFWGKSPGQGMEIVRTTVNVWFTQQMWRCLYKDKFILRKISGAKDHSGQYNRSSDNFNAGMITSLYCNEIITIKLKNCLNLNG